VPKGVPVPARISLLGTVPMTQPASRTQIAARARPGERAEGDGASAANPARHSAVGRIRPGAAS
jgi:hypothetical protein